jgi:hypothetical protein
MSEIKFIPGIKKFKINNLEFIISPIAAPFNEYYWQKYGTLVCIVPNITLSLFQIIEKLK